MHSAADQPAVVPESPLPGAIAPVVRFLLTAVPPWLQVLALAALAGLVAWGAVRAVRSRVAIRAWFASRRGAVRVALVAAITLAFLSLAGAGTAGWHYVQHDNGFCTGCHVMDPAFSAFARQDNKHAELSCHACHQQSILASSRQLYLWIADRPEEIGEHSKIRNRICENCHVTGDTARWQHVRSTAGHRVHLESDSAALKGLQCVTCHGVEIHRFRPTAATCNQSDCHAAEDTKVRLGRMAGQTVRHCTSCHGFTTDVPLLATTDSARGTLVPGNTQCLGCHEMRDMLRDFDPALDPHGGSCGSCHAPHTQETTAEAARTCTTAGCHADWRSEPFHVGRSHRDVATRCTTCHVPHRARVDASDCQGCHLQVRSAGLRAPPVRFDTVAARTRAPPEPDLVSLLPRVAAPASAPTLRRAFPHDPHQRVACLACHTTGDGHGGLTFETPRGCQLCHHESGTETRCTSCHVGTHAPPAVEKAVTIRLPDHEPRTRTVRFEHQRHASRACTECHSTAVSRVLPPEKSACNSCHAEHHEAARDCTACHASGGLRAAHARPGFDHRACDACHTTEAVARLTPARRFCAACHPAQLVAHYEPRECSTCHFLATPLEFKAQLLRGARP